MLVITRRPGESIAIDRSIEIVVLEVRGGQVRIGIDAPQEISIMRCELLRTEAKEGCTGSRVDL